MTTSKNILVTGSNRSGSTWVGKVISANRKVDNIIEPLNLNRIKRFKRIELDHWYPKIATTSPAVEKEAVKKLIRYYLEISFASVFTKLFEPYEGHGMIKSAAKRWRRASKPIKLLKDPTALFAIPWLEDEFNVLPVVLIRHPAAYALSIKDKNWWFNFDNFLSQPNFFKDGLEHLKTEVEAFKKNESQKDIIENAALLWKVFYTQVSIYRKRYPHWHFVTHEALSINPMEEFKNIFAYLGLDFSEAVEDYIAKSTRSATGEQGKHRRNSEENSKKWIHRLNSEEKETIQNITGAVSALFYDKFVES